MNVKHLVMSALSLIFYWNAQAELVEISKADLEAMVSSSHLIKHYSKCGDYRSIDINHLPIGLVTHQVESVFVYPGEFPMVASDAPIAAATPNAQIFILGNKKAVSKALVNERITAELNYAIHKRSYEKFQSEFRPFLALDNQTVDEHLSKIQEGMFANSLSFFDKNKLLLTFYPEIEEAIALEDSSVRPLLCHMQRQRHFRRTVQKWSNILVFIAAGFGISAITITSMGIALPPITILAGVTGVACGARDAYNGFTRLKRIEKTSRIAAEMQALIQESKKSDQPTLKQVGETAIDEKRNQELAKIGRKKFWNRILIAAGVITMGVNQVNFIPIAH